MPGAENKSDVTIRKIICRAAATGTAVVLCGGAAAQTAQASAQNTQNWVTTLKNDGLSFNGRYLGLFAANPAGGERQGVSYAGEVAFGARVDLGKMAGLPGGTINILFTQRHGDDLAAKDINNSISVQENYGGGETFQLTKFTYEQALFDGRLNIKLGRTDVTDDFAHSPMYCQFQNNAVCGQPYESVTDTEATAYPVASWGGRVVVNATPHLYVMLGAYQENGNTHPASSHGFTWGLAGTRGFAIPVEVGLRDKPADAAFANRVDVGLIFDRSHYSPDFYPNQHYYGRTLMYLQAQGRLWQPQAGSERGVYAFLVALAGVPADHDPSSFEINVGMVDRGLFAARPKDTLGISISETHAANDQLAGILAAREAEGGSAVPTANLMMFELNYDVQATPWLHVMPNFQYVLNPDGDGGKLPVAVTNLPNAVVLGLQFNISLPKVLDMIGRNT